MKRIAAEFDAEPVRFFVIYTREAHPGQFDFRDIRQHRSMEDKNRMAARLLREAGLENMTILIDDLKDSVTGAYRGFPNKDYIIGWDGKILHADRWASADSIRNSLHEALMMARV